MQAIFPRGARLNAWRLSRRKEVSVNGLEIAGGCYVYGEIRPLFLYIYEYLLPKGTLSRSCPNGPFPASRGSMLNYKPPLPDHFL